MLTVVVLIQAGVITGENVRKVFDYAKEHKVRRRSPASGTCFLILVAFFSTALVRHSRECQFFGGSSMDINMISFRRLS